MLMTINQLFSQLSSSKTPYCVVRGYHELPKVSGVLHILCKDPPELKQLLDTKDRRKTEGCFQTVGGIEICLIPTAEFFMPTTFEQQILRNREVIRTIPGLYKPADTEQWIISLFYLLYMNDPYHLTLEQYVSFRNLLDSRMGSIRNPKVRELYRDSVNLQGFKVNS